MTGPELSTFCDELNGDAIIGDTLKSGLLNLAKAIIEQKRPWVVLRSTDSSKSVTAANSWQTAIDLSTVARFKRITHSGARRRCCALVASMTMRRSRLPWT
jgi:hypothetical protein